MLNIVKQFMPLSLLNAARKIRSRVMYRRFNKLTTEQVFTEIYADGAWGINRSKDADAFFSGTGSHDQTVVLPYINAVELLTKEFPHPLTAVDLGCGDFAIGSQICHLFRHYTACDIVKPLIERNAKKYASSGVEFLHLDLSQDALPKADIVFVRQVLQHLSNDAIRKLLPKLRESYQYLVLTEHLSQTRGFQANIDKPSGPDTRITVNSGVVLTSAPFNLNISAQRVICEVKENGGVIQSVLITL